MNFFEKFLLGLLLGEQVVGPILVHSPKGIAILNANETLVAGLLAEFAPQPAPVAAPAPTPISGT